MNIGLVTRFMSPALFAAAVGAWADPVLGTEPAANAPARSARADEQQSFTRPQVTPAKLVLPARFRATVYEVQGSHPDALELEALVGRATTIKSLLKALGSPGNARILYQVDQAVNVISEQILVGTGEPVKVATTEHADGATDMTTYINVGLILHLSAQTEKSGSKPEVSFEAKLSTLRQSRVAPTNRMSAVRAEGFNQVRPLAFGQPRVVLGTESSPSTSQAQSATYVIRYVFDELRQNSGDAVATPSSAPLESNPNATPPEFPAQFEVTAYEVKMAPDRIPEFDGEALEHQAGTAETLLAQLAKIGEARVTYNVHKAINVFSDQVMVSTNEWLTTSARMRSGLTGPTPMFTRTAHKVGLSVRFAGGWATPDAARPNVTLLIQSSGLVPGGPPVGPEGKAERTSMRSITHSELLEFGKPRVMLSAIAFGDPDPATISVFRYVFSPRLTK